MKTCVLFRSNNPRIGRAQLWLVLYFFYVIFLLIRNVAVVDGQQPQQQEKDPSSSPDEETKLDLESMTQAELELICIERGFELIQDVEAGGEELTHADYVDAARRCLAIEEDM